MGVVNDPVEDGVGEGGFTDQIMPAIDRDLAGDQRRAAAVAVFPRQRPESRRCFHHSRMSR